MATVGDNQQLLIWDISNMKILAQKYLSFIPSAVKYSPDGDILIIGSVNGRLMLLDSQMQKNPHSAEDEQPFIISLEQLPFDNDQNISNTVLNIEFSSKGEMMVVSYGTLINHRQYEKDRTLRQQPKTKLLYFGVHKPVLELEVEVPVARSLALLQIHRHKKPQHVRKLCHRSISIRSRRIFHGLQQGLELPFALLSNH
jgi:hypothetical protein